MPKRWLIVPDQGGVAAALVGALERRGDLAEPLPAFDAASLRAALADPCAGVVHLAALDRVLTDELSASELEAGQRTLVDSALTLVQTLAATAGGRMLGVWFVTQGAQSVGAGEGANPAQASLWGLTHTVAIEHPELQCRRIDLDPVGDAVSLSEALASELVDADHEDQVARRGGRRRVRRLVHRQTRAVAPQTTPVRIEAERSYLVTGGLRGLGLRVAEWLVEQGARHLVLTGRRGPDERALQTVRRLEEAGVQLRIVLGDIGVRADAEHVFAEAAAGLPPLAGIVHSAGLLDDGVIAGQSWSRFATVMGPKVFGSWHLHTLAASLPQALDFLVLFSSGASLAGSAGQANHAAANAFEDALAWYRQARGLPTLSINWGPWAEIGAAADRAISSTGLRPIAPADGLAALEFGLRAVAVDGRIELAQLGVLSTDWNHLLDAADAGRMAPLFSELLAGGREAGTQKDGVGVGAGAAVPKAEAGLRDRIQAALPNRRKAILRDFVRQQTVKVLGVSRVEELDVNEPLRQLGLDSLMAVELRNHLGKAVGHTLAATVTFDHPTVAALVEHLATVAFAAEMTIAPPAVVPVATAQPASAPEPLADIDALNQDELADELMRRLDRLSLQEKS